MELGASPNTEGGERLLWSTLARCDTAGDQEAVIARPSAGGPLIVSGDPHLLKPEHYQGVPNHAIKTMTLAPRNSFSAATPC
jgi:hypothetical protein